MKTPFYPMLVVLAVAAIGVSPSVRAQEEGAPPPEKEAPPIPTLHCEMKTMIACSPDGTCKPGDKLEGVKLPLKVTIDFENSVVAAADDTGYARTDKIDTVAKSADQLMLHGLDGEFSWQLLVHDKSEIASLVMSTADVSLSAFGTCTNK